MTGLLPLIGQILKLGLAKWLEAELSKYNDAIFKKKQELLEIEQKEIQDDKLRRDRRVVEIHAEIKNLEEALENQMRLKINGAALG